MKTIYRKVTDRLPEKDGMYITDKGESYWGGGWLKTAVYNDRSPEYWLEEIQPPTEEIKEFIQNLINISPLLEYPDDTKPEHYGEAQAVSAMINQAKDILSKLK